MAGSPCPVKHGTCPNGICPAIAGLMDTPPKPTAADDRAARLAEQLRANLKRRKAQAREVAKSPARSAAQPPDQE